MKNLVKVILGLLFGLVSVHSLSLRAGSQELAIAEDVSDLFDGREVRKIEVRSPVSGILSKVNIRQTGYHSSGTAFVVTADSSQYYKSTINTGGKNVSVKRVIDAGRNVYIQIFRDSYVTLYTNKAVGDSVSQYDLLAILFVVKTRQGEAPLVKKLPRSVPTMPIPNPTASSTTVDLDTVNSSLDSSSGQISESVAAEEAGIDKEQKLDLTGESSPTVEAERVTGEVKADETSNEVVAQQTSEEIAEKADSTLDNLASIPEKSELDTDVSDEETNKDNDFSELSEFASDSEESKGASSSRNSESEPEPVSVASSENESQMTKPDQGIEPTAEELSTEIRALAENQNAETPSLDQGETIETQTSIVEVSEVSQAPEDVIETKPITEEISAEENSQKVDVPKAEQDLKDESSVEPPIESPIESPAESPVESPAESPAESATIAPTTETAEEVKEEELLQGLPSQPVVGQLETAEKLEDLDGEPSESMEESGSEGVVSLDSAGRMIGSDIENSGSAVENA
ncbi:Uncharacterized protein GY17_00002264 [Cryptosporidium hominis]|uniref:Uncharacterized protein n=1 Tax=Cryptosporidium hominis TaxID=237895 RepID=A0ABX5BEL7_CRYHO|nr:Uncharacterized protein GY17_00002264 [Cryptosporidium hominis]|eukprot:PPS95073.1 Uncharacterized protein GY17_00002264 [Cryptosporidium hominis]